MHLSHQSVKENLTYAYQIIAKLKMDDLIYTHISARVAGEKSFYICKFGDMFCEITPEKLLHVNFDSKILNSVEQNFNKTGSVIHQAIYRSRPDINAIFHLHTPDAIAVSIMQDGLLPLSQFSYPFFRRISYYDYDSLALDSQTQGQDLADALGSENKTILLRNHGSITCGASLYEAFFFTRFLENACKVQCKILSMNQEMIISSDEICEKAAQDMLNFEKDLGLKDWEAAKRNLL